MIEKIEYCLFPLSFVSFGSRNTDALVWVTRVPLEQQFWDWSEKNGAPDVPAYPPAHRTRVSEHESQEFHSSRSSSHSDTCSSPYCFYFLSFLLFFFSICYLILKINNLSKPRDFKGLRNSRTMCDTYILSQNFCLIRMEIWKKGILKNVENIYFA